MNEKEMVKKNIELSTEFSRYLFDHTDLEEEIPPDAEVILLPEFDIELKDFNLELGKKLEESGYTLIYKKILRIGPSKTKGNVDAELILNAMIHYHNFGQAVIVSGDGDYYCLIEYLNKTNKLKPDCSGNNRNIRSSKKRYPNCSRPCC